MCDFNDAYIVVTGKISATNPSNNNYDRKLALKNNASFFNCVTRIINNLIEDAQDLDIVMPMYNLLYYSKNYRKTTGSLLNYYRDEPNFGYNNDKNERTRMFYPIKNSESLNYKRRITGQLPANEDDLERIKVVVPLKYLSRFFMNLDTPLINCEIELDLKWSNNCVLTSKATREAKEAEAGPPLLAAVPAINAPSDLKFNITDCKLCVPVVTLSAEYENKLYQQLKEGFARTVEWNKYRCQVINQAATNSLNYLIDPTFSNVNRIFVSAFENKDDRSSFSKYYTPTVAIKDYNILIDQKPFFEIPIKNKEETYQAITELVRNGDYTTGNLLDYDYFSTQYKLIVVDLSKQNSNSEKQQINFIRKLEQDATIFFIIEEEEQTILNFSQNSLSAF